MGIKMGQGSLQKRASPVPVFLMLTSFQKRESAQEEPLP